MLALISSILECTGYSPSFLSQSSEPVHWTTIRQKNAGKQTESPKGKFEKMKEIFEIVRRNQERVSQEQARHYNMRRNQWKPRIGDVVHHLSKAGKGFVAKMAHDVSH